MINFNEKKIIDVFQQAIQENNFNKILIICRNIINKYPSDMGLVSKVLSYLINICKKENNCDKQLEILNQVNLMLSFVEENANLNKYSIETLLNFREEINNEEKIISNKIKISKENKYDEEIEKNNNILIKMEEIIDNIKKANNQNEFDVYLNELIDADKSLIKDFFTTEQIQYNDRIERKSNEIISAKMKELDREKWKQYNNQYIEKIYDCFKVVSKDPKMLNDIAKLKDVAKQLFSNNEGHLFNETTTYCNYIYGRILDLLDEEGKKNFTKFSIELNKN